MMPLVEGLKWLPLIRSLATASTPTRYYYDQRMPLENDLANAELSQVYEISFHRIGDYVQE